MARCFLTITDQTAGKITDRKTILIAAVVFCLSVKKKRDRIHK